MGYIDEKLQFGFIDLFCVNMFQYFLTGTVTMTHLDDDDIDDDYQ